MQNDPKSRKIRRVGGRHSNEAADIAQDAMGAKSRRAIKKKRLSKGGRVALYVLLALLLVGGGILAKFYIDISNPQSLFQEETLTPAPQTTATPAQTDAPELTPQPSPTPDLQQQLLSQADLEMMKKERVNILVLGIDESTERANWGSFRTDTMILVTINFKTHDVDMISIPRDSYVKLCNGSGAVRTNNSQPLYGKINSAFSAGGGAQKSGFEYAMGTVKYLFGGINVDYYIGFNMNVVKEVVNAMGGVDYDVDVQVNMNGRTLEPGMQHMDGQAVLDYARQRKGSSDIERVDRQQRILFAIFRQLKSTGQIGNIPEIYKAVEQNIQTNLSFKQISSLALLAMQMQEDQLGRHTAAGEFLNMDSVSYWGLHTAKLQSLVKEVFGVNVSIDADINAASARKRYEETRALISEELNAANNALNRAEYILGTFGANLTGDAKDKLGAAMNALDQAMETGDKELLIQYTQQLVSLNNRYLDALQQSGLLPQETVQQPEAEGSADEQPPVG